MSEFWKRKIRTFFTVMDFDKDGVWTKDTWLGIAISFARYENADKQKSDHIRTNFEKVWELYTKYVENKARLTMDEFVDSMRQQRYDPELMKREDGLIRSFFYLMDVNCDNFLQEDEHERLFHQVGVPDTSFAKETFKAMDVNGDGKLSAEEFVNGFYDYMYSEDKDSPNRNFFGPLVD